MRRHQPRVSNFVAGAVAAAVILAVCYLVFGGGLPFTSSPFTLKAAFTVETQLHLGSPVRIAGVNVGTVTSVQRVGGSSTAAVATMSIQSNGLPIHADATADIRPRLFLEGNFYVDLHPGTPSAPTVSSGATLPASQTTRPGAARPRSLRAALQHACRPADAAAGPRPIVQRPADRRPGRHPGSQRPGAHRRAGAQPVAQVRRRGLQGIDDRQRRAAGQPAPRPLRGGGGQRAHVRRAGRRSRTTSRTW